MIDLEFVEKLIRSLDESALDSIEIERGGTRIRLSKSPPAGAGAMAVAAPPQADALPAPAPASDAGSSNPHTETDAGSEAAPADEHWVEVTSPMVGTFFRAPSPGADPFTDVGQRISTGQTLCIIEAMKLMNELEAEVEGTVRQVLVENGEPVEYGQVLFRVEPG
jgi:acetyl-CoA carboxylase biotin carboxyl carrier protein